MPKALSALLLLVSMSAFAQATKPIELDFPEDVIEGDPLTPDQELVTARKAVKQDSLVKVRESFRDKVLQSANEL